VDAIRSGSALGESAGQSYQRGRECKPSRLSLRGSCQRASADFRYEIARKRATFEKSKTYCGRSRRKVSGKKQAVSAASPVFSDIDNICGGRPFHNSPRHWVSNFSCNRMVVWDELLKATGFTQKKAYQGTAKADPTGLAVARRGAKGERCEKGSLTQASTAVGGDWRLTEARGSKKTGDQRDLTY